MCNRKSIPKNATNEDRKPVCSHITTMCKEMQYIESIFPKYFKESAQSDGDVQEYSFQFAVNPEMEVNNEDENIVQNISGHFNINTGLWEYKSLSKHTPKDMMHPQNVNSTMQRNDFVKSQNLDPNTGLYLTYNLKLLYWEPMAHLCNVIVDLNIPMHQVMQLRHFPLHYILTLELYT